MEFNLILILITLPILNKCIRNPERPGPSCSQCAASQVIHEQLEIIKPLALIDANKSNLKLNGCKLHQQKEKNAENRGKISLLKIFLYIY